MDKTTRLNSEDLAALSALAGENERTQNLARPTAADVTLALADATLSLPDATLLLSSGGGGAEVTRALPPLAPTNATLVFKAALPEAVRTPAVRPSDAPLAPPSHAVVCTPPGADLDRRTARRARAVAVLVTRSDGSSLSRFRVTPPDGPDAPPGLVLYPRRVRDDCIRVDIAWLPPYPARPANGGANKSGPIIATSFRVHVDGVTATIPVRLFANGRRPAAEAASPELGAGGAASAAPPSENACGTFLASELAAALDPPPAANFLKTAPAARASLIPRWARPVLMGGTGVAALGVFLFAFSRGLPANGPQRQRGAEHAAPSLLASGARPGNTPSPAAIPDALAPPGLVVAAMRQPVSGDVAVVEGVDRWGGKIALWRVAGRGGATFPRVVVDTRSRAVRPGAVLTRLVTRSADLPAALVLADGLTLSPRGGGPLLLPAEGLRTARRRSSRPRGGALLLVAPASRGGVPFLRPLRRTDAGRFWAFRFSRPVHVGRGGGAGYSLLLSPQPLLVGAADPSAPRFPGCLLSTRGLKTWTSGKPFPPAQTVVSLPGFTVRVSVIEAAAFAPPAGVLSHFLPGQGLGKSERYPVSTSTMEGKSAHERGTGKRTAAPNYPKTARRL